MRDVVAELRALAAEITFLRHNLLQSQVAEPSTERVSVHLPEENPSEINGVCLSSVAEDGVRAEPGPAAARLLITNDFKHLQENSILRR
jgi:hypothetical protein